MPLVAADSTCEGSCKREAHLSTVAAVCTDRKMNDELEATRIPLHHVPVAMVVENITREKMAVSCTKFERKVVFYLNKDFASAKHTPSFVARLYRDSATTEHVGTSRQHSDKDGAFLSSTARVRHVPTCS